MGSHTHCPFNKHRCIQLGGKVPYFIVRHNPITGHRYVHTDGRNEKVFKTMTFAMQERDRLMSLCSGHDVEIHGDFTSARQAREYCRLRGEGLDMETAIAGALS